MFKNPNWLESDQLAIHKVELGSWTQGTEDKSSEQHDEIWTFFACKYLFE